MKYRRNIIARDARLRDALTRFNGMKADEMTLFVVDSPENLKVSGTLTNGDVRRALLAGHTLDSTVECAANADFKKISASDSDSVDALRSLRHSGITMVPVVDDEGRITDIADLTVNPTRLPLTAILMAGGKGERLRPLTLTTPKPLLEIDGKAIIDYNVEALARVGITDITVSTRYLADKIREHFRTPVAGVQVQCVTESIPMGTIGAASLVPRNPQGNTLIMNSDLLTTVSFEQMYLRHRDSEADITVGVIPYQVSVPYAILATDGDRVEAIDEKPAYSYYANGGIYIFRNSILDTLPDDAPTDAPDLIRRAIADGKRVTYHVIEGTWIDVGSITDFRQASEMMRHHRNLSGL